MTIRGRRVFDQLEPLPVSLQIVARDQAVAEDNIPQWEYLESAGQVSSDGRGGRRQFW